jgi:hypothetical protein
MYHYGRQNPSFSHVPKVPRAVRTRAAGRSHSHSSETSTSSVRSTVHAVSHIYPALGAHRLTSSRLSHGSDSSRMRWTVFPTLPSLIFSAVTHCGMWLGYPKTSTSGLTFLIRESCDFTSPHGSMHDTSHARSIFSLDLEPQRSISRVFLLPVHFI